MATEKQWVKNFSTWLKRFYMDKGHQVTYDFSGSQSVEIHGTLMQYQAGTTSLPEYKDHDVKINNEWLYKATQDEMNETACHEAIHLVTSPLHSLTEAIIDELPKAKQAVYIDWYRNTNEAVTTHLTNILICKAKEWDNNG